MTCGATPSPDSWRLSHARPRRLPQESEHRQQSSGAPPVNFHMIEHGGALGVALQVRVYLRPRAQKVVMQRHIEPKCELPRRLAA